MTELLSDLYILRHGETLWNLQERMQGGLDSSLTDKGHAQAARMAKLLQERGVGPKDFDLWSSPKGRARETARYVEEATGLVAQVDEDLREISVGDWVGLDKAEIEAKWPAPNPNEDFIDFYARAPNGDSFEAFWDRMGGVIARIKKPTVIVTHGMTSRFLRTRVLGLTLNDLRVLEGGQGSVFHITKGQHFKL